jgi:hypothetical protein
MNTSQTDTIVDTEITQPEQLSGCTRQSAHRISIEQQRSMMTTQTQVQVSTRDWILDAAVTLWSSGIIQSRRKDQLSCRGR